jgi:hypothetical protein
MERHEALENNWRGGLESAEPHFDDERTIQSAQPVVPLQTVANEQSRRRWLLVGAFVIASLLGSAVALALVRLRQPALAGVGTESEVVEQRTEEPVAQAPGTGNLEPESSPDAKLEEKTAMEPAADLAPRPAKPKRQAPATDGRSTAPRQVTIRITPKPPAENGEARLVDQWQERRQRRVSRKPQNHHRSELFRIREIFEGPRRPRRNQDDLP